MNNLEIPNVIRDPVYPQRVDIVLRSVDYALIFMILFGFLVINILALAGVIIYKTVVMIDTVLLSIVLIIMLQPFYFQYRNAKYGAPHTIVSYRGAYGSV